MAQKQRMEPSKQRRAIFVRDLNSVITCGLCEGYLIDAITLVECFHCFCRACILRYFENSKYGCPTCNTLIKKKSQAFFRPDPQMQSLVYKLVPSLYAKEIQRREDFYRSTGVRASSACSDDSVIDRERDMINEQEKMISKEVGDKTLFLSPEDSISLSLEYYQAHLDTTDTVRDSKYRPQVFANCSSSDVANDGDEEEDVPKQHKNNGDRIKDNGGIVEISDKIANRDNINKDNGVDNGEGMGENNNCDKRYLQCPGAVSMKHLQKFIRMKYGLTDDHKVDIIYKGEVLSRDFSLIDVAYSFKWKRTKPMRFFYRIFTPMKVRPIKIVNTTLSTGGKQLQIVPIKHSPETPKLPSPPIRKDPEEKIEKPQELTQVCNEDQKKELFAHLQLKCKTQAEKESTIEKGKDCVYEYEEPDQEEIKKFAEKRDREWALQKKLDENRKREEEEEYNSYHFTKKRKKNKHSKNEFNQHKKRKLHAEIASNDEDLKLKVKITNNGHKHKHHKSSMQVNEKTQQTEISSKEKLLQMRQVRHKHLNEEKAVRPIPTLKLSKDIGTSTEKPKIDPIENNNKQNGDAEIKPPDIKKLKIKVSEPSTKVSESAVLPKQQTETTNVVSPKIATFPESKTTFAVKPTNEKECKKIPTVQIERSEQVEKQAQKTIKPTINIDRFKIVQQSKDLTSKNKHITVTLNKPQQKPVETKNENNKVVNNNNKILERQIANLQQHFTIEPKQSDKIEKRVNFSTEKPKIITSHYPPGFTVSKIEQGVKRKSEDDASLQDTRPSLEITLINPPAATSTSTNQQTVKNNENNSKPVAKRPPPATIPLEKIKKSVNSKSGISIIPKLSCDNIGALDLSKSGKSPEISPRNSPNSNGFTVNRTLNARPSTSSPVRTSTNLSAEKNIALSNLQMLSKVATEHSSLTTKTAAAITGIGGNKPKPQMPSLQTIKVPLPLNQVKPTPNLQKIPKLNEIQKFRPSNLQIRSIRPNPNQNIRNIPNPSLLIRQQNQNRLNSQINVQSITTENSTNNTQQKTTLTITTTATASTSTSTTSNTATPTPTKETSSALSALKMMEAKMQDTKEISV